MGAKASFIKGAPVMVKVPDGRGGHTLQSGTVKDTAGKGAVVRFTNGGHERFVFATDISPDTEEAKPAKVKAPEHFAPKVLPSIGQLFRAERVSRELTVEMVAEMLGIHPNALKEIEGEQDLPGDDLVLKFIDVIGANLAALVEASDRARLTPPRYSPGLVNIPQKTQPSEAAAQPAATPAHVQTVTRSTTDFVAIDAWVSRLRKMIQAIGTFKHDAEIVLTHRVGEENAWKVHVAGYGELGKTAGQAMGKLTTKLEEAIAGHIAARRKELAELESLSAAAR
jgi:hypothetical protein